jgi:hypothetical protein
MKRIALLLLLTSAAFGQSRNPRTVQTQNTPPAHEVSSRMLVTCVVAPSAVVSVPLVALNTKDLEASHLPPQTSAYPQTYWVPLMPNRQMSLASLVTVNDKTMAQSEDIPFTAMSEKDDKYIYITVTF